MQGESKNPDGIGQFLTLVKNPMKAKDFSIFPCTNKKTVVYLYYKNKRDIKLVFKQVNFSN